MHCLTYKTDYEKAIMQNPIGGSKRDRIQYIQALLAELRKLAEAEHCDMLTYMIEMAYIEATDIVNGQRPTNVMPSSDKIEQRNTVSR